MSELRLFPALVSRGDAEIMTHAYVKDIMTAAVVAVRADASYQDLAGQLRRQRVSGFPVVDDEGMVIGVVSESDLLAAAAPGSAGHGSAVRRHLLHHQQLPAAPTAADLMTSPTVTIGRTRPPAGPPSCCPPASSGGSRSSITTVTWSASSAGPTCSASSPGR